MGSVMIVHPSGTCLLPFHGAFCGRLRKNIPIAHRALRLPVRSCDLFVGVLHLWRLPSGIRIRVLQLRRSIRVPRRTRWNRRWRSTITVIVHRRRIQVLHWLLVLRLCVLRLSRRSVAKGIGALAVHGRRILGKRLCMASCIWVIHFDRSSEIRARHMMH